MELRDAVIWSHRLLLNRDPEDEGAIAEFLQHCQTAEAVRSLIVGSAEFGNRFIDAGRPLGAPVFPVDLREGVIWAYRLIYRREPTEPEISAQLARVASVRDIRAAFFLSVEFETMRGGDIADLAQVEVLNQFAPFANDNPPAGFFRDFLGSLTRVSYLPAPYIARSGMQETGPNTPTGGMHGVSEWVGTLRSVLSADSRFTAIELGAGWAPWLVSSAQAAKRRGIDAVTLIGVEASAEHVAFARQHFLDNGLDPQDHRIIHAAAGAEDGIARFPRLIDPSDHYGANAAFDMADVVEAPGLGEWEEIACVSLKTVIGDIPVIDILHCDVQGGETPVLTAGIDLLNDRLKRIVVGTHSRRIDAEMMDVFGGNGWVLEHEQPTTIAQQPGGWFATLMDGEQVWRNPRLH